MTRHMTRLFAAGGLLAGGMLVLGMALWWHARSTPVFRFLRDQQPVDHRRYPNSRVDTYILAGEFESVCAEISQELSHIGGVEVSLPLISNFYREFSRPGFNRIAVRVHRGKFELRGKYNVFSDTGSWVTVEVAHSRLPLLGHLRDRLARRAPASPGPSPPTGARPQR